MLLLKLIFKNMIIETKKAIHIRIASIILTLKAFNQSYNHNS